MIKKIIFALLLVSVLLLAGCGSQDNLNADAVKNTGLENKTSPDETDSIPETSKEDLIESSEECYKQLDRIAVLSSAIAEYEANAASQPLLNNALAKISELNKRIKEFEECIDEIESMEFENKEEFISANREFTKTIKSIASKYSRLYNYELDMKEQASLGNKNKIEELLTSIVNCRCGTVDCNSYLRSSFEYMDSSIEIFEKIRDDYNLEIFDRIIETWKKEKAASEKFLPALIRDSERYGTKKCYNINDNYAEYLNELDKIDVINEGDIANEVSEKWLISLLNLSEEIEQKAFDVDEAYSKIGV